MKNQKWLDERSKVNEKLNIRGESILQGQKGKVWLIVQKTNESGFNGVAHYTML